MRRGFLYLIASGMFILSCASYVSQSINPSAAERHPLAQVKQEEWIKVTVLPIVKKEDAKAFFDSENLNKRGFVPVYLTVQNLSKDSIVSINSISIHTPNGGTISSVNASKAIEHVKKGMVARSAGWFLITGVVGAAASAVHTQKVNERIYKDLENKEFKLGNIEPTSIREGYVYFILPENIKDLQGSTLVIEYTIGNTSRKMNIGLKGKLEAL